MGSGSGGGGGSDSTKLGKIDPPGVARPYIPHEAVNHALAGNWRPGLMSPHGTTNPQPYTDTEESIQQALAARNSQSMMFAQMLRELGMPQQAGLAGQPQPNYAMPSNLPYWTPQQPITPPPTPLSPAGIWTPTEINA